MVTMVSKMLKNYNYIVQTVLFLVLAIGTQGKAAPEPKLSPYIFNSNIAECAEDGNYSKRDELMDHLNSYYDNRGLSEPIPNFEVSCFKYWLDEDDDRNIIVITPQIDGDKIHQRLHNLRGGLNEFFTKVLRDSDGWRNETITQQKEKITFLTLEIIKAGDIFPKSSDLHGRDVVSTSELTSLIEKDRGLSRLVQLNLTKPIPQNRDWICVNEIPSQDPFYNSRIDGRWGRGSKAALVLFAETCQKSEQKITGPMIAGMILPQLFVLSDLEATPESVSVEPGPVDVGQTSSEDVANQDTESETSVTSTLEPIVAAEKDVEGTPVEDRDAGLEHEKEISSLRDKLEEKEAEISQLNEAISNLMSSNNEALADLKNEISKKTIFQVWADLGIKVIGIIPDVGQMFANTQELDSQSCRLSASEGVMKSAVEAYKNLSCYQHTFGDWEIDRSKSFSWDEGEKVITVHLLPQREKYIKSMETAGIIDGLTENNLPNCGIELSLLKDKKRVGFDDIKYLYSYLRDDGRQGAYLNDGKMFKRYNIAYEGVSVLLKAGNIEDQKCSLPSGIEMPISTKKYKFNGLPQALIDRDGHVTIHDLPISAVKGATLAVFFDTNVGFDDAPNYAFNAALTDKIRREVHKKYFSGFSQALKNYLTNQSKFENIIIYQSLSEEDAINSPTLSNSNFRIIFEGEEGINNISNDELNNALDEFVAEFNPGQKGSFSDKRKEIKLLLESSNPIEFLSFGPSGLDHSEVCNVEKRLRSSKAVTIFDVWPRDTLDELLETEQLFPPSPQLVHKCANNERIFGVKVSISSDKEDISRSILDYLNEYLGKQ